ncbi:HNH endonuclease [Anaeromyxobacter sp. Fw109-5]|uniref:HNH endonuclease n=1 Tax=Anaeromyxobacter sp. (strain Fw109-5) TaxID=404589 RepID=UPI0000ED6EF5|nr:HNH endonuclease signature motif containing protein [Anaeromyxobacter sp. Fw109-5]ABS28620.1 HNH endonuclease [Anaeromyxobacter sp. Fw109-5]
MDTRAFGIQLSPPARPSAAALEDLGREAWVLEPPMPHERKGILRDEAALLLDRLLTSVARGHGALDVSIGRGLAALEVGDRALRLGYSGTGDYARERLGIAASTAQKLARLARQLRDRPLLAQAVRLGEVSARKAETIAPVARGDVEAAWVERARKETVRTLAAAVRAERDPGPALGQAQGERTAEPLLSDDEPWERVCVDMTPEGRARLDEAMALAGETLGATSPRWERLEAICAEFLGAHPVEGPSDASDDAGVLRGPVADRVEAIRAWLEQEFAPWTFLATIPLCEAEVSPELEEDAPDLERLDAELRRLAAMRDRWDELLGHLGLLVSTLALWRDMKFQSFAHYCQERLGMGARTVQQRVALERRLYELPPLREAMRAGRVSYEKARIVAEQADDKTVEEWLRRAEGTTCIALRRESETEREVQMCARGELDLRMPRRVASLLEAAVRAARAASDRWLKAGECLERVAEHFLETWKDAPAERSTPQRRAMARDGELCQVPGCSRAAVHAHHVVYRSRGGSDDPANLTSLCAVHHLRGVHRGYLRVRGQAPDRLSWTVSVLRSR